MAWDVSGDYITMTEEDFGVALPFSVTGTTLTASDTLRFTFKNEVNGTTILEKEYTPVNNASGLMFTEAESALFKVGKYVYRLDWYQNGLFMYNLVECGTFRVVEKA